jgi:hypothetical protein
LAARIARLEDIEAIRQLKALYCEICDAGHDPERITGVFTEDGVWDGGRIGRAEGHAAIRALFERFGRELGFTQHMTMNPRIEVDGDRAHGSWYLFGPFTIREGNRATWQAARYEEDYLRTAEGWRIHRLTIRGPGFSADYATGWTRPQRDSS